MKTTWKYLPIMLLFIVASCQKKAEKKANEAEKYIAEVRSEYAPDSRVALFDVESTKNDSGYVLKGESNLPKAVNSLKKKLKKENINYTDSISILPDNKSLNGKTFGVVKISVANLRDEPKHSAQLVTQATLGTPVKVYKKQGSWYYIQTPDNYLAWVDYGGIEDKTQQEFDDWKASEKLIYLNPYGKSFKKPAKDAHTVTDLVAGDILELQGEKNGFYKVKYPEGKTAYVEKNDAQKYKEWLASLDQTKEDLVKTSEELMGLPYLWGGTSPKGVDCSGFTKTIYFLNGIVLPRDASQQIQTGKVVDSTKNFENLIPGDLLFFGKKATDSTKERVIHVGMWIGNNQFIHSMGEVHTSTMDTTASDFDEYNYNRYLRTKRILDEDSTGITYLTRADIFTDDAKKEKSDQQ